MSRRQLTILLITIAVMAMGTGLLSTASVLKAEDPVAQTISDPFCATSDDKFSMRAASLIKRQGNVTATWTLRSPLPASATLKMDLASVDFKYQWVLYAVLEQGRVARVATLDTVSKQFVGYEANAGSTSTRVIGSQIEVSAPLPGAPDTLNWFAAAAPGGSSQEDVGDARYVTFCPAGWLAKYPPSTP